jgi:Calcineurin-like phosphoesterase
VSRIAVIGDVAGHADQLRQALESLGVDRTIPPDLVVIQVGDLVDRGPSTAEVLATVGHHLKTQPAQWIQLVGNHDSQYVGGPQFWREEIAPESAALLREWWEARLMNVAAAVHTDAGDEFLVTHAGLTVGGWRDLGEPMTAAGAAMLLNDRPADLLLRGGELAIDRGAGPLWAEAGWELHEPWMEFHNQGGFVPFGQIHGHSSAFDYETHSWRAPEKVRLRASVDESSRHVVVRIGGRQFIGVDPKHNRVPAPRWRPYLLEGEVF